MKVLTTILLMTLTVFSSCSKDEDSKDSSNDSFFVKIDNIDYNPEFINGFIVGLGNNISISGSESNGNNVVIIVPVDAKLGDVYTVEGLDFVASFDNANGDAIIAKEGSIIITSHDMDTKRISGTFNFVGKQIIDDGKSFSFTQGKFNVAYKEIL